jgi:hypothetical protein
MRKKIPKDLPESIDPTGKSHKQKKFREYIYEFFMLFLAVTAGFYMDNKRESMLEHRIEKEYAIGLIRDLKEDTADLRTLQVLAQRKYKNIDSMIQVFNKVILDNDTRTFKNFVNNHLANAYYFDAQEITIIQIRNSGGLRLFQNRAVTDSIVKYYSACDNYQENNNLKRKTYSEILGILLDMVDFHSQEFDLNNKSKLKEFFGRCAFYSEILAVDSRWLKKRYAQASSLLKLLQKEYKME